MTLKKALVTLKKEREYIQGGVLVHSVKGNNHLYHFDATQDELRQIRTHTIQGFCSAILEQARIPCSQLLDSNWDIDYYQGVAGFVGPDTLNTLCDRVIEHNTQLRKVYTPAKFLTELNHRISLIYDDVRIDRNFHPIIPKSASESERYLITRRIFDIASEIDQIYVIEKLRRQYESLPKTIEVITCDMSEFLAYALNAEILMYLTLHNCRHGKGNQLSDWRRAPIKSVKLKIASYGGARTDRLAGRNALTSAIGMIKLGSQSFWNLEEEDGSGTFFADVVRNYGYDKFDLLVADGKLLRLRHDCTNVDNGAGYGALSPNLGKGNFKALTSVLDERLSTFENFLGNRSIYYWKTPVIE